MTIAVVGAPGYAAGAMITRCSSADATVARAQNTSTSPSRPQSVPCPRSEPHGIARDPTYRQVVPPQVKVASSPKSKTAVSVRMS